LLDGFAVVGLYVGVNDVNDVGFREGEDEDGFKVVGLLDGIRVGEMEVGFEVGVVDGDCEGLTEGNEVGGNEGPKLGFAEGNTDGASVGSTLGLKS